MSDTFLKGSICLTDIPRELIRSVTCKDGTVRKYLDVAIFQKREPKTFQREWGEQTFTHYISCAPAKDKRVEGVNYYIGDLETRGLQAQTSAPQQPSTAFDVPF